MYRHTLIVPDAADKVYPKALGALLNNVRKSLCNAYGGYSEYRGSGGWKDDSGNLIIEPHTRFETVSNADDTAIIDLAKDVRDALHQDCVLVTTDAPVFTSFI